MCRVQRGERDEIGDDTTVVPDPPQIVFQIHTKQMPQASAVEHSRRATSAGGSLNPPALDDDYGASWERSAVASAVNRPFGSRSRYVRMKVTASGICPPFKLAMAIQ